MFIFIIVGLLIFSFLLALFSLWRDLKKNIRTDQVSEELSKGRVIFHAPTMPDIPIRHDQLSTDISDNTAESVPNLSESPITSPTFHHENPTPEILKDHSLIHISINEQQASHSDSVTPHIAEEEKPQNISTQIQTTTQGLHDGSLGNHTLSSEETTKKTS